MEYLVVVEPSANGYGAYVSDLPGDVTAAATPKEVVRLAQEAIELHIKSIRESGDPAPPPTSQAELVDVHAG